MFVLDLIRTIKDPEKPNTLEELNVVYEDGITVNAIFLSKVRNINLILFKVRAPIFGSINLVRVEFNPTIPHCSLATLIGLCIRIKLERNLPWPIKLDIYIKAGAHTTEHESKFFGNIWKDISIISISSSCVFEQRK